VEGVTLDQALHRGPIPYGEAAEYIAQTLNALSYAHGRGVIHRDIKPANIAVLPDGTVKLLDFGIARGKADQRITLSGMVVGSLLYMSPEQVSGSSVDARSDLYSVGITLYQAVTGVQPFRGESQFAVMQAQLSHIPDPPAGIASGVPAGLSDAIMRAIEKDPARRFASAAEFQTAVEPFRSGETRTALARGAGAPAPAERIRSTSQIDSSTLEAIARNLAQFVGPFARRLVDTRSRKAASVEDLCHDLADEIVAPGDRTRFLSACREQVPAGMGAGMGTGSRPGSAPGLPAAIDPRLIECARKELASYTGPLAKVIVDRMLKKARTADELITRLGEEIDSKADRERFLRTLRQFGR
jgi:serine/threonine-protein kinase